MLIVRIVLVLCVLPCAFGGETSAPKDSNLVRDTQSDTWAATDGLGRVLPDAAEARAPRTGKFVGIFYFLWMTSKPNQKILDLSKLIAENPANPEYGPVNAFHWWTEPELGYYSSDDPAVIRTHAQMLTDAGVDMVVFDVTNAITYESTYLAICVEYTRLRALGRKTPQIAFICWSKPEKTAQKVYDDFYKKNLYPELWFRWKGKPLLLAPEKELSDELKNFFTVRTSWAWTAPKDWFGDGKDKWPWLDHTPQQPGWHESKDKPEQICVCVAEHPTGYIGRSFHDQKMPPPEKRDPAAGLYFAEQWKRALEVDPEFVFVTGWNEWIAQRFIAGDKGGPNFMGKPTKKGDTFFVDTYNEEFSRDIEPMKGGHGDAYYYQLVANIRKFKGMRPVPTASAPKTIPIGEDFTAWKGVTPEYYDDSDDPMHRDHPGFNASTSYKNDSGRNDFIALKTARDDNNLYFYAQTKGPITEPSGNSWMLLFLDTDPKAAGWNGFDFVINRTVKKSGDGWVGTIEKNVGGWKWEQVGECKLNFKGNELQLSIPRKLVGLDTSPLGFDFKWADNIPGNGDVMDFMTHGDAAPNGRFKYRYSEKP